MAAEKRLRRAKARANKLSAIAKSKFEDEESKQKAAEARNRANQLEKSLNRKKMQEQDAKRQATQRRKDAIALKKK